MARPAVGDLAPDFTALTDTGKSVRLSSMRGKIVVLYFYPKDDTSGCTVQACEFRDAHARIRRRKAVILGVSPDSVKSHGKFRTKFELPFTLLADTEKEIVQAYDVWKEKTLYGRKYMGVERTTFLIDSDGVIQHVFEQVKPEGHAAEVLAAIKAL